jgi:hypothetical protein
MPTLKHLIDELKKLSVDPDKVRLPGILYDDLVEQPSAVVSQVI